MSKRTITEIEQTYGIPAGQLMAVIYRSDCDYGRVVIYGSKKIATQFRDAIKALFATRPGGGYRGKTVQRLLPKLDPAPPTGRIMSDYLGISGTFLLVESTPPGGWN